MNTMSRGLLLNSTGEMPFGKSSHCDLGLLLLQHNQPILTIQKGEKKKKEETLNSFKGLCVPVETIIPHLVKCK